MSSERFNFFRLLFIASSFARCLSNEANNKCYFYNYKIGRLKNQEKCQVHSIEFFSGKWFGKIASPIAVADIGQFSLVFAYTVGIRRKVRTTDRDGKIGGLNVAAPVGEEHQEGEGRRTNLRIRLFY